MSDVLRADILKTYFFDINIEFSDDRHFEDYKKENAF